jgi:hypothetical protein
MANKVKRKGHPSTDHHLNIGVFYPHFWVILKITASIPDEVIGFFN